MVGPRHFLLGGVALLALTGVAAAADVPVRGPVYTKAPAAFSWEGQYIGVHGGYFSGDNDVVSGLAFPFRPEGAFGGLQIGYLHHLSRNWVIGYEVDVSFGNIDDLVVTTTNNVNVFGTARTRLGYAQGPWLFYATGGLAWAKTDFTFAGGDINRAQIGYAVGAGIEYAFARNWSAKLEYLYFDLGETNTTPFAISTDMTASTVRLGLNYRFANWNVAPVAAMPVKAPVRVSGWTGPYIGAHVGYGWGDYERTGTAVGTAEPDGGFLGIQSGYNWQFPSNWVIGVEGDASWGSIRNTTGATTADIDAMGTVRARLGYANGNILYYATGGLAWLHADVTLAGTRDQFWLGWTGGAGIEYAFSPRWSAKIEYLYSDYSSKDTSPGFLSRDDFNLHTVKLGLNYRAGIFDLLGMRW